MTRDNHAAFVAGVIVGMVLLGFILFAAGCGSMSRSVANMTGYSRTCIGGVSYLQFPSGVTVEWTPEGKVRGC